MQLFESPEILQVRHCRVTEERKGGGGEGCPSKATVERSSCSCVTLQVRYWGVTERRWRVGGVQGKGGVLSSSPSKGNGGVHAAV